MSTWAEEKTLLAILTELKAIRLLLERPLQPAAPYPPAQPIPAYDPNRCGVCGGFHGPAMVCPALVPTTISVKMTP